MRTTEIPSGTGIFLKEYCLNATIANSVLMNVKQIRSTLRHKISTQCCFICFSFRAICVFIGESIAADRNTNILHQRIFVLIDTRFL